MAAVVVSLAGKTRKASTPEGKKEGEKDKKRADTKWNSFSLV